MSGLGRQHSLGARRQRGVAYGPRLVVGEVPRLLLGGERVPAQVHGEHQVRLLDHLLPVQLEVREMQQQGVLAEWSPGEIPFSVLGEVLMLLMDADRKSTRLNSSHR